LLIVNQSQFGYHIDYYKYCKYLKNDFDISFICWDYGWNKITEEGVAVFYISRKGNIVSRNLRFIMDVISFIKNNLTDLVFIHYFRGCSLIKIFTDRKTKIHLDIRSGSVSVNPVQRNMQNFLLRMESSLFKSVSIISEGLKMHLRIPEHAFILPLGADKMILNSRPLHRLSLIYVGTLYNRNIEHTIEGLTLFLGKNAEADIHYTIIGTGWNNEEEKLRNTIRKFRLDDHVELKGYVHHDQLKEYFEKANVGISYIPEKPWYEFQPATKTFEYLMAGMPVIATGTYENKKIISEENGIIIKDVPVSFATGLEMMYNKIGSYDPETVRATVSDYKWTNLTGRLKELLLEFYQTMV